jgi:carbon monoxide dehydrogenase subunit G
MPVLQERLETSLPLEATFAFVADFANASRWDPGVATSRRLDQGPVGAGARYRLGIRMRGRVSPMDYTITTYEAPRRVVLTGTGSGVSATDDIRFEPSERGTRIDYTADIRLTGLLRLLTPFLGGAFTTIARKAVGGMQRALDDLARQREARA